MTNKAGRTVRKQIPEPVIPEGPPLMRCCPKCSNLFAPKDGGLVDCPSCGAALSETAYDERARAICESLDEIEARLLLEKKEAENGRNGAMASCLPGLLP